GIGPAPRFWRDGAGDRPPDHRRVADPDSLRHRARRPDRGPSGVSGPLRRSEPRHGALGWRAGRLDPAPPDGGLRLLSQLAGDAHSARGRAALGVITSRNGAWREGSVPETPGPGPAARGFRQSVTRGVLYKL